MHRRTRWIAGFSALTLVLGLATTAAAYQGQVPGSITVRALGSTACGTPLTVTATVLDATGAPIDGQSVAWNLVTTLSSQDEVNRTPTTTDAQGVATTTVTLACVNGSRSVRAVAGDIAGEAVMNVAVQGLPNTSTLPTEIPAQPDGPGAALLLVALAFLAGAGVTLRRLSSTGR